MYVCEDHGEVVVVYDNRHGVKDCPLCEADKRIGELESIIENLRDERDAASERADDLQSELDNIITGK